MNPIPTTQNISTMHDPHEGGDWDYPRTHPCANGVQASPCAALGCPLALKDKDNDVCYRCGWRTGRAGLPVAEIQRRLDEGKVSWGETTKGQVFGHRGNPRPRKPRSGWKKCSHPLCSKHIPCGQHCSFHGTKITKRRGIWKREGFPGAAPDDFIYTEGRSEFVSVLSKYREMHGKTPMAAVARRLAVGQ